LLAHQTPLSRRGFSPKSVSGISRPLQRVLAEGKFASEQHIGEAPLPLPLDIDLDQLERAYSLMM
ncbi:hypothetical protein N0430_31510, partial [Pseudomonas aeruginosa]|nr:hypothetical protein [Pseudomonas aeruginosa]MCT1207974.1 hypothetical protein [Pseudomonas aeruginosa]